VNYVKEINAFYRRVETNAITGSATALWHTLMHINNRAGWVKEFSVAASVICAKSGLPLSTFKRARNELRDKGYLAYTSRGTEAPVYQMVSLVEDWTGAPEERLENEIDLPNEEQGHLQEKSVLDDDGNATDRKASVFDLYPAYWETDVMFENPSATPPHQNDSEGGSFPSDGSFTRDEGADQTAFLKEDENALPHALSEKTYRFYVDHVGEPSTYARNELRAWADRLSDAHVYEALVRAVENGVPTWRYAQGVLSNWWKDQLFTLEDVLEAEKEFRKHRKGYRRNGYPSQEVLPDWWEQYKQGAG